MLKKIILNGKRVPVPVPIRDLGEAIAWIEKHLVRPEYTLTRIQVDNQDIDRDSGHWESLLLTEQSDLRCKVDSPQEICIQTLDALRNLSSVISRNLKPLAVYLWEYKGPKVPPELQSVLDDVHLMQDLLEHILLLVDKRIDVTNVISFQSALNKTTTALQYASQQNDWKAMARILLNQLEAPVFDLGSELSSIEKTIFEIQADRHIERRQKQGQAF